MSTQETPKDRAAFMFDLFLLLIAFALYLVIGGCGILALVAFFSGEFLAGLVLLAGAGIALLLNRLIILRDDKKEEKKAKAKEEARIERNKTLVANSDKFGRLQFEYDDEENVLKLSGKQLPQFGNTWGFEVIRYDSDAILSNEVAFLERLYQDEELILDNMCKTYYEFCQKENITQVGVETVDEEYIRKHLQITRFSIGEENDGDGCVLSAMCEECDWYREVQAFRLENSDQYQYYIMAC